MQLKKFASLGGALAAATCGLLGSQPSVASAAGEEAGWQSDTSLLYYGESDSRVTDVSLRTALRRAWDDGSKLSGSLTLDSLTGASPTGAVPTDSVQTFTRPSGKGQYTIGSNEQPLDDTFKDTRIALTANWDQPLGDAMRYGVGLTFSTEYDYRHMGANGRFEHDFNQRNTTLQVGMAYARDSIDPVGGAPIGLHPMKGQGDSSSKLGNDSKSVIDLLIGVTQVVSRRSLLDLSYTYSRAGGYLNDPYKLLTVVDNTGRPVGVDPYLYESRPDARAKHGLFSEWRYAFDEDSLALSYRYMFDDWGIKSHTLEGRYRWNFDERTYLEPHLRYYMQSAADFYRTYLESGATLPVNASSDYRLADLDAWTAGIKFAHKTSLGEFSARLEYYRQTANPQPGGVGLLNTYDLVPPLTAIIGQIGYRLNF